MPQIFIDGKKIHTEAGKTVIEAAHENGINITHFCWHPELSVSGNCRMCLVEVGMPKRLADGSFEKDQDGNPVIGFFPKLQIACATTVTDGMHVKTNSEQVITAQEAVMEFVLINHPLDCPICDEAGQCKLQEYAFNYSNGESRFEENKNPNMKRTKWGPNVMFDAERCIQCSRCIRFSDEVAGQPVLTFTQRGDHTTIKLFEGTQLDNPYSMNVIDICPVGALTSPDFRFKSRVWDMSFNDSICTGCSKGCNIKLGVRNNEILRIDPKTNMHVNKHWICDHGRLNTFKYVNENRITKPFIRKGAQQTELTWPEAFEAMHKELSQFKSNQIQILASANLSNEDIYSLCKLSKEVLKTDNISMVFEHDENFQDDLLKDRYKSSNYHGAKEIFKSFNINWIPLSEIKEKIDKRQIKALYVLEDDLQLHSDLFEVFDKLDLLIVNAYNHSKITELAHIVFPASTYAEKEGTFVNKHERVQHFAPALITKENLRYMGLKMSRLDKFGAKNDRWTQHEARDVRPAWWIVQNIAAKVGKKWNYKRAGDIFEEMSQKLNAFADMNYAKLDEYQGLTLAKGHIPDKKLPVYQSHFMKP